MWCRCLLRLTLCIVDHIDEAGFSDFANVGQRSHAGRWPLRDIVARNCSIVRFCWHLCRLPTLHASAADREGEELRAGCTAHHWRECCEKHCVPLWAHLERTTTASFSLYEDGSRERQVRLGMQMAGATLSLTSPQGGQTRGMMVVLCV